jgi:hypothetical protein
MEEGDDRQDALLALIPNREPGPALNGVHHKVPVREDGPFWDACGPAGVLQDCGIFVTKQK